MRHTSPTSNGPSPSIGRGLGEGRKERRAMELGWNEELQDFYDEVVAFARERLTPELQQELESGEEGFRGPRLRAIRREIDEHGWMRMCWPVELGGEGKSLWYQFILSEVLGYLGIQLSGGPNAMVAPALQRFGTEE